MSDIFIEQLVAFSGLEWLATLFSIIYIVLATRNNVWCFSFAIIASTAWAYVSYYMYHLGFDAILQIFYALMAVIGIFTWSKKKSGDTLKITRLTIPENIILIVATSIISLGAVYVVQNFITDWHMPHLDSLTTGFSISATVLLIFRKVDSWVYLLICDLIYAFYIYPNQGAYLFAAMMIIFSIMAIIAYRSWIKQLSYLDVV